MKKVSKTFLPLFVAGIVLALGLAACGGSDDSSSSSDTAAATTEESSGGPAPTGDPIVLGMICDCSGIFAASQGAMPETVKAWEESVNAEGGINGHPVEVKIGDDEANPTKALAAAKKLVEQDKIVALVGSFSVAMEAFLPYLEEKEIPIIGGYAAGPAVANSEFFFPSGANQSTGQFLTSLAAIEAGHDKLASAYCTETPQCKEITAAQESFMKELGGEVVETAPTASTEPNFIAQCVAIKESGATALTMVSGAAVTTKVAEDCEKQGVEAMLTVFGASLGTEVLPLPISEGMSHQQQNAPASDATPGGAKMIAAIEEFQPDNLNSPAFGSSDSLTWSGFLLFRKAAEVAEFGPTSTREDLENALYTFKDETLEGMAPPLTFEKGKPKSVPCGFVETVENEEFVAANNAEPLCMPEKSIPNARKAFGEK